MGFEQLPIEEDATSQEQLAMDYLDAYKEYKKISEKRLNDLKLLDSLRDEASSPETIMEQEELLASSREEEQMAMEKYVKIAEKLTPETKDKILK